MTYRIGEKQKIRFNNMCLSQSNIDYRAILHAIQLIETDNKRNVD